MEAVATVVWWGGVIGAFVVANRKGRRGWAYGLLAAFVPVVGLVVALIVPDRRTADLRPVAGHELTYWQTGSTPDGRPVYEMSCTCGWRLPEAVGIPAMTSAGKSHTG